MHHNTHCTVPEERAVQRPQCVQVKVVIVRGTFGVLHKFLGVLSPTFPYHVETNRLVGLVVEASTSRSTDPGFESRFHRGDFSDHTSDLKRSTNKHRRLHDQGRSGDNSNVFSSSCLPPQSSVFNGVRTGHTSPLVAR